MRSGEITRSFMPLALHVLCHLSRMLTHALGVCHHLFRCRHGFVGLLHGLCTRDLVGEGVHRDGEVGCRRAQPGFQVRKLRFKTVQACVDLGDAVFERRPISGACVCLRLRVFLPTQFGTLAHLLGYGTRFFSALALLLGEMATILCVLPCPFGTVPPVLSLLPLLVSRHRVSLHLPLYHTLPRGSLFAFFVAILTLHSVLKHGENGGFCLRHVPRAKRGGKRCRVLDELSGALPQCSGFDV